MSVGGISSFAALSPHDVRAEFERLREVRGKNGSGGHHCRRVDCQDEADPRPI